MAWDLLASGLLATGVAAAQLFAWLALGSYFLNSRLAHQVALPLGLLIGSGITAAIYAVLAALASAQAAVIVGLAPSALAAALRWRQSWQMVRYLRTTYQSLWGNQRWLTVVAALSGAIYWSNAIMPPRRGDVLKYHLAHIRQIITDGKWQPIPDYHYALPFGWSLNQLPFEYLGLPQVAALLNVGLWVIVVAVVFDLVRERARRSVALLLCAFAAYQPLMFDAATTALSDMYHVLVILSVTVLVVSLPEMPVRTYALLGFASCIGAQSRYQAVAIGFAVGLLVLVTVARRRAPFSVLFSYGLGAAVAATLSAPFYIFNLVAFGNPVWPLMITAINGLTTYADQVANVYSDAMTGAMSVGTRLDYLRQLFTDPNAFPIPLLAITFLGLAFVWREASSAPLAALLAIYLCVWAAMQPILYARFSIVLIVPAVVGMAPLLDRLFRRALAGRIGQLGLAGLLGGYLVIDGVLSYDSLHYLVTRDVGRFHQLTWFYEVYDWANRSTPANAKFLVIVLSGQSYYLDRAYRRADPWLSGVVDWPNVGGADDLALVLDAGGYDFVIYEDRDWTEQEGVGSLVGGEAMSRAMKEAVQRGMLVQVAEFHPRLGVSRFRRLSNETTVWVLRREPTGAWARG